MENDSEDLCYYKGFLIVKELISFNKLGSFQLVKDYKSKPRKMFCCKPNTLCYYTIYIDPSEVLFEEQQQSIPLAQKFRNQKSFLYLPRTMHFPSYQPSLSDLSQPVFSSFKGQYELTFSDQTHQIVFRQLVKNPLTKIWRVLLQNQQQNLNEGDSFSFDGFNFQVYHLPKKNEKLSNHVTYLDDSQDKCRICFGNDTSELNPLLNFCKCSGSIKYMHLDCCRSWVQQGVETMQGPLYSLHVFYNGECNICKEPWKKKIKHNKKEYLIFDFEPRLIVEENQSSDNQGENQGQNIIFFLSTKDDEYELEQDNEENYVLIFKLRLPEVTEPQEDYSFRIGKSFQECDVVFEHMMIDSPIQCEFKWINNKLSIKDMNSNNGTNVLMRNSKKSSLSTKEGLFFRYMDTVYNVRGEKYLFSCFQPNITYNIKYKQFKETVSL